MNPLQHLNISKWKPLHSFCIPKLELIKSVNRARQGQWPRTPPVYLYERCSGARPPWPRKVNERVSGGEDSGARPAEGSIGLNSIWVKLTQRREEQRTLVGEVADARYAGEIFSEKQKNLELFPPFCLFIFRTEKGPQWIFFLASGDSTILTRSWFDKSLKWPSLLGKLSKCLFLTSAFTIPPPPPNTQ